MCYANQLLAGGGGTTAARRLADAGASGVIVADLTPDEGAPFEVACRDAGIALVYLVAPTTPADRRAAIAARTGGFLYTVSLVGVTGAQTSLPPEVGRYVRAVKASSPVPVTVGFGVSRPAHVRALVRAGADGVIVASALIDALGEDGRDTAGLGRLVQRLRAAAARWAQVAALSVERRAERHVRRGSSTRLPASGDGASSRAAAKGQKQGDHASVEIASVGYLLA